MVATEGIVEAGVGIGSEAASYALNSGSLVDRDGQYPEYSGEEQAICAVGLARAKPGVFIEAIQHIIVLATPVEVRGASKRAV